MNGVTRVIITVFKRFIFACFVSLNIIAKCPIKSVDRSISKRVTAYSSQ